MAKPPKDRFKLRSPRWMWMFVWLAFAHGSAMATPRFAKPTLYLNADTLKVDVSVDSLFSSRAQDAIASGMTTSIVYEFLLKPVGPIKPTRMSVRLRLDNDIWEGRYQIIRGSELDTLVTEDLDEMTRICSNIAGAAIGPITEDPPFVLSARAIVNPISSEQVARTRKWLNLLDRGSVLELFFSLAPKDEGKNWVEIARFRKSDLPQEVPTPAPPPTPSVEDGEVQ